MKVHGARPEVAFTFEEQPNQPGYYMARFFENIEEYTEEREGQNPIVGYQYDEYKLILKYYPKLEEEIASNLTFYLEQAKLEEEQNKPAEKKIEELKQENSQLKEKNNALEEELTNTQLALCELYESM